MHADTESHREDPAVTRAQATLADSQRKLDRYLNALEAGMKPDLLVTRMAALERQRAVAEASSPMLP